MGESGGEQMKRKVLIWSYASGVLGIPLLALMYFLHQIIGIAFLPYNLFELLLEVRFVGLFGIILMLENLASFSVIGWFATLVYYGLCVLLGVILLASLHTNRTKPGPTVIIVAAALFGFPSIVVGLSTDIVEQADFSPTLTILLLIVLFSLWGVVFNWLYGRLRKFEMLQAGAEEDNEAGPANHLNRRQFLGVLGLSTASVMAAGAGIITRRELRISQLETRLAAYGFLPSTLKTKIFPSGIDFRYPEFEYDRFDPTSRPIGVCFPGGGARATAAAIGQIRGLMDLGLLDYVGAMSCVSGGAVFGALLEYAPKDISLHTLLGPSLTPEAINLSNLAEVDPHFTGTPWTLLTNEAVLNAFIEIVENREAESTDRIFSHILRKIILEPFNLGSANCFQALGAEDVNEIIARNPALHTENFYAARSDAPFFISGATHVYPTSGQDQAFHHFEYTPQYVGTPQRFLDAAPAGVDFGGGYVQTFAFNSDQPGKPDEQNIVTVNTPDPVFSIGDVLGSSIAAPGFYFNQFGVPNLLPGFKYWPIVNVGRENAIKQSFTDGAALENFGIVPLLRRHYPLVLFFVNTETPLGSVGSNFTGGMDHRIGRLFGIIPENLGRLGTLDQQIFETDQFAALSESLLAKKENGEFPIYVEDYAVKQPNPFGIPPYPGDGKVTIVWFYNDINVDWQEKLPTEIKEFLDSEDPLNNMSKFPYLGTLNQNKNEEGIGEVLSLTQEQIKLTAHMWCYTLTNDAADLLTSLTFNYL